MKATPTIVNHPAWRGLRFIFRGKDTAWFIPKPESFDIAKRESPLPAGINRTQVRKGIEG